MIGLSPVPLRPPYKLSSLSVEKTANGLVFAIATSTVSLAEMVAREQVIIYRVSPKSKRKFCNHFFANKIEL